MAKRGFLDGAEMATTFNMLRANDLIWSFVINNYLLGKDPFPFDLLYWNSDNTRMPAAMHSFYLRKCYHENVLVQPGARLPRRGADRPAHDRLASVLGLDQGGPYRAMEEHLRRRRSYISGEKRFVLAGSGHIAGVVNPPVCRQVRLLAQRCAARRTRDVWFEGARHHDGSWWTDWAQWNAGLAGDKVAAREPGAGKLPALEDAPGSYVKLRLI